MSTTVRRSLTWSGSCLLVSMLCLGSSAWGAGFKMGVVDPQAVLEGSKAGQRALSELKQYAEARQKILAGDEHELKTLQQELENENGALTDDERQAKQQKFREKLQAYQQRAQDFNQELATKQKQLVDEYMQKIRDATKVVAQKEGLSLVMDKGSESTLEIVIYSKKSLDVTDQVIAEFDRRYK